MFNLLVSGAFGPEVMLNLPLSVFETLEVLGERPFYAD